MQWHVRQGQLWNYYGALREPTTALKENECIDSHVICSASIRGICQAMVRIGWNSWKRSLRNGLLHRVSDSQQGVLQVGISAYPASTEIPIREPDEDFSVPQAAYSPTISWDQEVHSCWLDMSCALHRNGKVCCCGQLFIRAFLCLGRLLNAKIACIHPTGDCGSRLTCTAGARLRRQVSHVQVTCLPW